MALIRFPSSEEQLSALLAQPLDVCGRDSYGLAAIHKLAAWNAPKWVDEIITQKKRGTKGRKRGERNEGGREMGGSSSRIKVSRPSKRGN